MSGRQFYMLLGTIELLGYGVITQSEVLRLMFLLNALASVVLCVLSREDVPASTVTVRVVDERDERKPSPFGVHTAEEMK